MTTKRQETRAFLIHDERGEILGAVIPADPEARCGIRTARHCVSTVTVPKFESAEKLDAHVVTMVRDFRVEAATTDRPAQLVRKPDRGESHAR